MSMDRKKSKYLSETKFWAFGSLKAEKTRGGHNGPSPCGYVIPDPMWNRVKVRLPLPPYITLLKSEWILSRDNGTRYQIGSVNENVLS